MLYGLETQNLKNVLIASHLFGKQELYVSQMNERIRRISDGNKNVGCQEEKSGRKWTDVMDYNDLQHVDIVLGRDSWLRRNRHRI